MSDIEVVAVVFVPSLVLFVGLMRAPRWFAGSLFRHAIWRLRDDFVDDTLAGRLPMEAAAVQAARRRIESVLADHTRLTFLQLLAWHRAWNSCPAPWRPAEPTYPAGEMTASQSELLGAHLKKLMRLSVASALCSSWLGLLYTIRFFVPAMARRPQLKPAVAEATSRVNETEAGRYASEYLWGRGGATNGMARPNHALV